MASGGLLSSATQRRCCSTSQAARSATAKHAWVAPALGNINTLPARRLHAAPQRRSGVQTRVVDPAHVADVLTSGLAAAHHLPVLASLPAGVPACSIMACGDLVHKSTLDPVLRGEATGVSPQLLVLLALSTTYLVMPPGVLPGAIDYYLLAKLRKSNAYSKDDITLGRKLGSGGFGSAFLGEMKMADGTTEQVVVKKAKEFGEAEAWMNERMMRLGGKHVAEFITAFDETLNLSLEEQERRDRRRKKYTGVLADDAVWLVWKYEGGSTLWDLMQAKDFPYNLEPVLLERELRLPKGPERQAVTVRLAFKQLLEALAAMHATGIVHRDVKPQNCIVSEGDHKIKLIDLGAAADLRIGINYQPNSYLLDPRYAPPQQYVMSTQTPTPPPAPVAAFLSPVLWRMENPDRFDMYSCGVTLLQMAFPHLRNDNNLIAFNKRFEGDLKHDLRAWRAEEEARKGGPRPEVAEGLALLDLDNGAGWNLLCSLLAYKPTDRCSAAEALVSPFFTGSNTTSPSEPLAVVAASQSALSAASRALDRTLESPLMADFVNAATGQDRGALTEALISQEFDTDEKAPAPSKRASNTIVWWKERQSEMRKDIERRQGEGSQGSVPQQGLPMHGARRSPSPPSDGGKKQRRQGQQQGKAPAASSPLSGWLSALSGGLSGGSSGDDGDNGAAPPRAQAARRNNGNNGNGNGNGKDNKGNGNGRNKAGSPGPAAAAARRAALPLALPKWGGRQPWEQRAEADEDEEREVELVGQRRAGGGGGGGLGFLVNVLGGGGRGNSGGSSD